MSYHQGMRTAHALEIIIKEGEGQKVEFKENFSSLAPIITSFANSTGGRVLLGVDDAGNIKKLNITNRFKSQITDTARNCDPPVKILLKEYQEGILEIIVPEGGDKPYKCKDGFFLRIGPNSQKMSRDEIVQLIQYSGKVRFDEIINEEFKYPEDFNKEAWGGFVFLTGYPKAVAPEDMLVNLGVASFQEKRVLFSNAAILFFAKDPQKFHPEAKITCLKYLGNTRAEILDKREFKGTILEQLEASLAFFDRYNAKQIMITGEAKHKEWEDYPKKALREILINALIHRDYFYDSSHTYLHMYDHNLEVDNPGGLFKGMSAEDLGKRAIRRNRMLADLMQRAGYIENAGTGITRIKESLKDNNNPAPEFVVANFFTVRLKIRPKNLTADTLTERQKILYSFVIENGPVSKSECQKILNVSPDTTLNELKQLIGRGLLKVSGKGKNTRYFG